MYFVEGIIVQGHVPIMWNVCKRVLSVAVFNEVSSYEAYILIYFHHFCT